jgi:hypothetical protein
MLAALLVRQTVLLLLLLLLLPLVLLLRLMPGYPWKVLLTCCSWP